jgi:hypothetical protein
MQASGQGEGENELDKLVQLYNITFIVISNDPREDDVVIQTFLNQVVELDAGDKPEPEEPAPKEAQSDFESVGLDP